MNTNRDKGDTMQMCQDKTCAGEGVVSYYNFTNPALGQLGSFRTVARTEREARGNLGRACGNTAGWTLVKVTSRAA